jgi:predicted Zn-dependent protease
MRIPLSVAASALLFLFAAPLASALQHDHAHTPMAGERLGTVDFPISCKSDVRAKFARGVAALHSFWYDEAEKTFNEVAAADPGCGMAWWGTAMSNYHPLWAPPTAAELQRGREAAEKARAAGASTPRERAYIAAISKFYDDSASADHGARSRAYEAAMEKMVADFPEDREARIFYALSLISHGAALPNDKTYQYQKKAAEILNTLLKDMPEHPGISHYVIHSFDYPALAHLAVPAARAYSRIAPSSAHALHMPSHIFIRLGMWGEAIDSNTASAEAGRAHVARTEPGVTSRDQLHAYDYLAYGYLQRGDDKSAKRLVDALPAVKSIEGENFAGYYALAAIPVRYALERRNWSEAAALAVHPLPAWNKYPYAEALTHFARAIGSARTNRVASARKDVERLNQLRQMLVDQKNTYWADQVDIQRRAAEAWIARAEGRNDDALVLMRGAADAEDATEKHPVTPGAVLPAREMLADLLLELDRPAEALAEFERSLKDSPNRLNGVTGAARAAQLAGDREKAKSYYLNAAKLLAGADPAVLTATVER